MSHNVSNLYAAKIFAEHPLSLWALDDDFAFRSLLNTSNKTFSNWSKSNLITVTSYTSPENIPMPEEALSVVSLSSSLIGITASATAATFTRNSLDITKDTVCVSTYVYAFSDLIESYDIGFLYDSTEYSKTVFSSGGDEWQKISYTNDIPLSASTVVTPFIRIKYQEGGPVTSSDYDVAFNGLSVGQWSEMFNTDTTGIDSEIAVSSSFDEMIPTTGSANVSFVTADSYGITTDYDGYYVIDHNKMLATNSNFPMVFGSSNITNIRPPYTANMPSLILPGRGFLNESGRYLEITAEFWLRVYTQSPTPIRIFGPLMNSDGLYVEEEFLTLRIGKYTQSYYVGKWYRPMLIDIRYTFNLVSLLVNGDLAFELPIVNSLITLPEADHDYLGFFGHEDVYPYDLDCVAIYSYIVPEQIAKRRFVYGQGVDVPENIVSNFNGESIYIDFPYSKYTSTINYPDMNGWDSGFFNNLEATSKYLTFPTYSRPEVIFSGDTISVFQAQIENRTWSESSERTWSEWAAGLWNEVRLIQPTEFYQDNFSIQDEDHPFIKLRPNESYDPLYTTIFFQSINPINTPVKSIFGVFKAPNSLPESEEILMYFTNKSNSNIFKIILNSGSLQYLYNSQLIAEETISASANFIAGFDIDDIVANYGSIFGTFFSNPQNISMNLGNYQTSMFSGKIYNLTFNNRFFTDKDLSEYINEYGFFESNSVTSLIDYIGNYTMSVLLANDAIVLDVGSIGYWEDSLPLSYFGKYISSTNGESYYDLDMLQFNIDYPSPLITNGNVLTSADDDFRIKTYITRTSR